MTRSPDPASSASREPARSTGREPARSTRCLCATVRRASRLLNRRFEEALRPAGVSPSQFELMMTLRAAGASGAGGATDQAALARLLETDQTTLSRNLKPLLDQRWIETAQDKQDARRRSYRLTRPGHDVLRKALRLWKRAHSEMEDRLAAPISELWPLLDRILQAAREPAPQAARKPGYLPT